MLIKWISTKKNVVTDITDLVPTVTWEGSIHQATRKCQIDVLNAPNDKNIQDLKVVIACGDVIKLFENDELIFYGEVQRIEKKGETGTVSYEARDILGHLLRIEHNEKFKNKRPEQITKKLLKMYGYGVGNIEETKKVLPKLIVGSNVYEAIMKAYKKAATGEKYMLKMQGKKVNVIKKGELVDTIVLDEETNIISSEYEETIENMVNRVDIFNKKGKQIGQVKNAGHIKRYGLYKANYEKEKNVNAKKAARVLLTGPEKSISVEVINGDVKCVAGMAVEVKDKVTGLSGIFYVDQDVHTWSEGNHKMKLDLNFKNVMEESS